MTCSKALNKPISVFSALLLAVACWASDLSDYRARVEQADSAERLEQALQSPPESLRQDGSLRYYFEQPFETLLYDGSWEDLQQSVLEELDGRAAFERAEQRGKVEDPKAAAEEILKNPLYTDRREKDGRNWLERAGSRIGDRMFEFLRRLFPRGGGRMPGLNASGAVSGLTAAAWFLLGAAIIVVVYFVFVNFRVAGRKRRVGGILEDDEPELTADEWLVRAAKLEGEGKLREAVRCLYIACLVRYDDGRVARFRRQETNWEHLRRIEASPESPREVDFRELTQRFDKLWYGRLESTTADVAHFREVYQSLCRSLKLTNVA